MTRGRIMTLEDACEHGFEIVRGSYTGTTDDRMDRWYIQRMDTSPVDRRGSGYATQEEALEMLEKALHYQIGRIDL